MATKAQVLSKAIKLGYAIEDTSFDIRLEAPNGYCFDQDHHELVSEYGDMSMATKAEAWQDIYNYIGTAELCEIEECDWCNGN